jgi:hypothetical protein
MPYQPGERLPGERASRLGHLDVLKSDLVKKLCGAFERGSATAPPPACWSSLPSQGEPLPLVFGVDGSLQIIQDELPPPRSLGFVKTALLRIDGTALAAVDKDSPHPLVLRDILADAALYHATVFPLRHVQIPGLTTYHAVRQIIFESMADASLQRQPLETLKWLAYEKWDGTSKQLPFFECPHCEQMCATLPYDAETGNCPTCGKDLYLTDMLGFHQEMAPDAAPDSVATAYMLVHETLLLFTGIRHYWEGKRDVLQKCLFVKDGPLSIRAQYSKLVAPIRRFLAFAEQQGVTVCVLGQEKTGAFVDHLGVIGDGAPEKAFFLPGDKYIKAEIQHRPDRGAPYGKDTNYGAKVFVKLSNYHKMVLNVPTRGYVPDPKESDLLGFDRICATLPSILSNRHEGALLPIELAHGVASLSTYPSARILKIFADATARPVVPSMGGPP